MSATTTRCITIGSALRSHSTHYFERLARTTFIAQLKWDRVVLLFEAKAKSISQLGAEN